MTSARVRRRRAQVGGVALVLAVFLIGGGIRVLTDGGSKDGSSASSASSGSAASASGSPSGSTTGSGSGAASGSPSASASTPAPTPSGALSASDDSEGEGDVTPSDTPGTIAVPSAASGVLQVVPGEVAAPPAAKHYTIRFEVEDGIPIDREAFADLVISTLNDPRSWGAHGGFTFGRTGGATADLTVVMASPNLSAQMCLPLKTGGVTSCRNGGKAIFTYYRWVNGTPDYGTNIDAYRLYVINHEVGHFLGHGHQLCPGPGQVAPVMQQQTLGLHGCLANSWPFP
jgi:hypothetical protein